MDLLHLREISEGEVRLLQHDLHVLTSRPQFLCKGSQFHSTVLYIIDILTFRY